MKNKTLLKTISELEEELENVQLENMRMNGGGGGKDGKGEGGREGGGKSEVFG